ncbi:MAG: hypothetical protein M3N34_00985 [Pseudomonadota bacterium]|nr:hypothetical protein [Pseudomonadota bacterium]
MSGKPIILKLGNFTFGRGEVPESIGFGASQGLHVHTLVGGARIIDAMGAVPFRPEWSGWFTGPQALARARFLKKLAEAGQPLALRFGEFAYTVMISAFSAEFHAGPNLPYSITLEVVSDHGAARPGAGLPGLTQMVALDLADAVANAGTIGDGGLIACMGAVSAAMIASGDAVQSPAAVRPLLPLIAAAQAQAVQLNVAASAQLAALEPLSVPGVTPGPDLLSAFGTGLGAAAGAASQSRLLSATAQALARMADNLNAASGMAGGSGIVLTTGTGDLYHLAAVAYGDARAWTRIAQANQLTDPMISGVTQLVIPPASTVPATGVFDA